MFGVTWKDSQIFRRVVKAQTVRVINHFRRQKVPLQRLFHQPAMLGDQANPVPAGAAASVGMVCRRRDQGIPVVLDYSPGNELVISFGRLRTDF